MTTEHKPIDLAAACGALPSGGELAGNYGGNLTIRVEGVLSFTGPMRWGVRVEKPTTTASGRRGKPQPVVMLVANDDEGVPDLLRQLAHMWELGAVTPGETYPAPPKVGE